MAVAETPARDMLDLERPRTGVSAGQRVAGPIAVSATSAALLGRQAPVRLSDAVPAEARVRIDEFLRTGRLDTSPFSFKPIDAVLDAPPRKAALEPPGPAASAEFAEFAPQPRAEAPRAQAPSDKRLPFEIAAQADLPGNRFDLLPVSLTAVRPAGPNR
jgi:hypothetical protein